MSTTNHGSTPLRQIAVWIDHREAMLAVFVDAHLFREGEIFSKVGPHTHGGGWSQKRIQAHRHALLDHFYEEVANNLTGADEIMIYGPGQAKHELYQHLYHHGILNRHVRNLVTTDRLSEQQFIHMAVDGFTTIHAE